MLFRSAGVRQIDSWHYRQRILSFFGRVNYDYKSKYLLSVKTDIRSCTIICDSGLNADGLSTACFSLGVKKSQKLLKKYNAKAVFVDKNNNVYVSDGVEFTLTAKDYKILNL